VAHTLKIQASWVNWIGMDLFLLETKVSQYYYLDVELFGWKASVDLNEKREFKKL